MRQFPVHAYTDTYGHVDHLAAFDRLGPTGHYDISLGNSLRINADVLSSAKMTDSQLS